MKAKRGRSGPLVSIIVVCRDQLAYTRLCLESVRRFSKRHELILVDNGSADGTGIFLSNFAAKGKDERIPVRVIRNRRNRGFAGAVNQGIRSARGKFLLFLNNDVVVTPGYLRGLLAPFKRDSRIGAVAPTSNPPPPGAFRRLGGKSDDVPVARWSRRYRSTDELAHFGWAYSRAHSARIERKSPADFSCFCHMVRREMVRDVGGMDERYSPAYVEDIDFFYRAVRAGWKLTRVGAAYVHHFWGVSSRGKNGARTLYQKGKRAFINKWGTSGWKHSRKISFISEPAR